MNLNLHYHVVGILQRRDYVTNQISRPDLFLCLSKYKSPFWFPKTVNPIKEDRLLRRSQTFWSDQRKILEMFV